MNSIRKVFEAVQAKENFLTPSTTDIYRKRVETLGTHRRLIDFKKRSKQNILLVFQFDL